MRWIALGVIVLGLVCAGIVAVIVERQDDDDHAVVRERSEPWRLVDVGPGGRTLKLVYDGGGCARGDGRAIVHASRSTVRIELRQGYTFRAKGPTFCPANLRRHTVTARLPQSIGGRRIEGSAPIASDFSRVRRQGDRFVVVEVPRVIGLAVRDAVELLGYQRFRPRLRGATIGQVVSQQPRPGTPIRITTLEKPVAGVTLTLRRH